ncbi:MAG: carbonic anhydrase [Acidobacteria bacterium]|nr:carbonic anhydrase [Acidobacteriota bacterium]
MRTQTQDIQTKLTPEKAFEILVDGNRRFVNNLRANRNFLQQVNETSDGQFPFAIVLSCIDSRTSAELIFDQGLGDIFSARVAGNVVNEDILGSMEFACQVAGSKLIVVLGHSKCGAVKGACNHVQLGHLTGLLNKISPAVHEVEHSGGNVPPEQFVERVALENTRQQMRAILERSPILEHLFKDGKIGIVGGMYSVESGEVTFFEQAFQAPASAATMAATR